jgi:hypothetical protein
VPPKHTILARNTDYTKKLNSILPTFLSSVWQKSEFEENYITAKYNETHTQTPADLQILKIYVMLLQPVKYNFSFNCLSYLK